MAFFGVFLLFVFGGSIGIVVLLYTIFTGKIDLLKWTFFASIVCVGLVGLLYLLSPLWTKMELDPKDYCGKYVIDCSFYPGRQAKWQYNHFRFEILPSDSVLFYVTEGAKIVSTYRGKAIWWTTSYSSVRMRLDMDSPTHFIMASNPTTYRSIWDFRLIFATDRFGNVAFKKGKWKSLEKE